MRNARMDEAEAGIKIAGRNINNLRYADDTTFKTKSEEELKNLLMKMREDSGKVGLKFNIQKKKNLNIQKKKKNECHGIQSHHFTADRWGNNGNSDKFYFPALQTHCRW